MRKQSPDADRPRGILRRSLPPSRVPPPLRIPTQLCIRIVPAPLSSQRQCTTSHAAKRHMGFRTGAGGYEGDSMRMENRKLNEALNRRIEVAVGG